MDEIRQVYSDIPELKQVLECIIDDIISIQPVRDQLVVTTKHRIYFLHFNEDIDLWQVIHGLTEVNKGE